MEEHEKNYYFILFLLVCRVSERFSSYTHPNPIQERCFDHDIKSAWLQNSAAQPNWISDQLATPWLHNSEVEKGRQTSILSCGLVGQASQASLLQPRHLQMVSQIQQNSASSADDHRLMIMGYFIAKTHPLPKKVLQVAPKKIVMLAVLCHLWEATVLRNLWGTTQASATWLKPRRSALRVT